MTEVYRNFSTLFWVPPFSLDLTGVDPDIVFCLEVYNITCGRNLLIRECDVMNTSYTNYALLPGYMYEYNITSRSNVKGARNGRNLTVIGGKNKLKKCVCACTIILKFCPFSHCFTVRTRTFIIFTFA